MWIFTNREVDAGAASFTRRFQPGADTLGVARVTRAGAGTLAVDSVQASLGDDAMVQLLVPLFNGSRPVLVYLHGNDNPPTACFERCARLEEIYGLEVIGFSWPSEGFLSSGEDLPNLPASADGGARGEQSLGAINASTRKAGWAETTIRRYRQAKVNAQDSGDSLARFLRLTATARLYVNRQPMTIAGHSLGCHFIQYAIESEGAAESLGAAHNIALLAACCRAEGHASWVSKLNPKGQLFIAYNKGDNVLFGAFIADGHQVKIGTEPGARVVSPKVRYVSFTNAPVGLGGHAYFVRDSGDVPKAAKKVFQRMFGSERDIREDQGEYPRKVYPVGCDADGSTCYMAAPDISDPGGPS